MTTLTPDLLKAQAICQLDVATADANPVALGAFSIELMHSECPVDRALLAFAWLLRNPERLTEVISQQMGETL